MNAYERERKRIVRRERIARILTAIVAWGLLLFGVAAAMFLLWLFIGLTFALFGTPPGV